MTGKKIKPDLSQVDAAPTGKGASVAMLIHDMKNLAQEMSGGKPLKPSKVDEEEKPISTTKDLGKQLDKLEEERKLAFRGMPKKVGAKKLKPSDTQGQNVPTRDEQARQIAVAKKLKRDQAEAKKDKASEGKQTQDQDAADRR